MIEWGCLGVFGRCDGVCLRSGYALPSATAIRVLANQARRIILCSIHGEHHLLLKVLHFGVDKGNGKNIKSSNFRFFTYSKRIPRPGTARPKGSIITSPIFER